MEKLSLSTKEPWLLLGDFNTVFDSKHRVNGVPVGDHEMRDGLECIQKLQLSFIKDVGQYFSWNKRGEGENKILSRVDHCLGSPEWMMEHGEVYVQYLCPRLSDHNSLLVKMKEGDEGGGRPFRFFNYMVEHSRFDEIIKEEWCRKVGAYGLENICKKIQNIKKRLKALHIEEFKGVRDKVG